MQNIKVLFIAGFGPIVPEATASRKLYSEMLGISFQEETGGYLHTRLCKAQIVSLVAAFAGSAVLPWQGFLAPRNFLCPKPGSSLTLKMSNRQTGELEAQGHRMLVKNRKEPWDQTVSRFITPEGLLLGITFTPSMRNEK